MKLHHTQKRAALLAVRCISFVLIFALGLVGLSAIFVPKYNDPKSGIRQSQARGFYGQPKDTLDIIGIGNSNLLAGLSPMELWHRYGYTGYTCAEAGETVFEAYNLLHEVLTCQKPKVVILECDGLITTKSMDGTFGDFVSGNLERIFPVVLYHNRWKTLSLSDFTQPPQYTWTQATRGYLNSGHEIPTKRIPPKYNPHSNRINLIGTYELEAFQRLCEQNGAHLVLVYIPTNSTWNQQRNDELTKYAKSHRLPFIDMNEPSSGVRIDWQTDTRDGGVHLNDFGAIKVTACIGDFVHSHYQLPDHRGDPAYLNWASDYTLYKKMVNKETASARPR